MSARTACPHCGRSYELAPNLRGKKVRCKNCQETFVVEFRTASATHATADDDDSLRHKSARPTRRGQGGSNRRWMTIAAAGLVSICALALLWMFVGKRLFASEVALAQAELDRNSPGWRLEEMEAKRADVPADRNSAVPILACERLISKDALPEQFLTSLREQSPLVPFDPAQIATIKTTLQSLPPALAEARKIVDLPSGRHSITYERDGFSTKLPHAVAARRVVQLLSLDAAARAHDGDIDGALASSRAMVNVARSFADEPMTLSQLVRIASDTLAVGGMERALAQGEPSETALATTQRLLEDEASQNTLLIMFQCERGSVDAMMSAVTRGDLKAADLAKFSDDGESIQTAVPSGADIKQSHAWLLRHASKLIEISQLPCHDRQGQIEQRDALTKSEAPEFAKRLAVGASKLAIACQRNQARLSCAAVGMAAERYRRANGKWPETLQALVPAQVAAVPLDPYDGKALRMIRHTDGVTIYAIGMDLQDNRGVGEEVYTGRPGTDIVFRLVEVARRKQPPGG